MRLPAATKRERDPRREAVKVTLPVGVDWTDMEGVVGAEPSGSCRAPGSRLAALFPSCSTERGALGWSQHWPHDVACRFASPVGLGQSLDYSVHILCQRSE